MHLVKYALVCAPANTLAQALRMKDRGVVDVVTAQEQHRVYLQALARLGFTLIQMPHDDQFPDSVFVEDPAVAVRDTLIITRLRREERIGEEVRLQQVLTPFFSHIAHIEAPGFVEGGDVLVTDNRLYIGLSGRTNEAGAEQLAKIARDAHCYHTDIFEIPKSFLHLKGEVTYHRGSGQHPQNMITVSEEIRDRFVNSGCKLLVTPAEERFGANCISGDGQIFIHKGRSGTRRILEQAGFHVSEIPMSEFEKIDGALTCMSKLFPRSV